MRPGRAADHSPLSSAAVMEEYSYTSTHPLGHTGPVTGSLYLYIYIYIFIHEYLYIYIYIYVYIAKGRRFYPVPNQLNLVHASVVRFILIILFFRRLGLCDTFPSQFLNSSSVPSC